MYTDVHCPMCRDGITRPCRKYHFRLSMCFARAVQLCDSKASVDPSQATFEASLAAQGLEPNPAGLDVGGGEGGEDEKDDCANKRLREYYHQTVCMPLFMDVARCEYENATQEEKAAAAAPPSPPVADSKAAEGEAKPAAAKKSKKSKKGGKKSKSSKPAEAEAATQTLTADAPASPAPAAATATVVDESGAKPKPAAKSKA